MSLFNKTLNGNAQVIIAIMVIKCPTVEEYKTGAAQNLIISTDSKRALIDTGASNACISQEYADELELIPIGKSSITTAGSNCDLNRYKINFCHPTLSNHTTNYRKNGKKNIEEIIIGEKRCAHAQYKIYSL